MSRVYYNEFDRKKAAWLRNLIEEGLIADGVVDERSITEVQPDDLAGFSQHHFFAGIGLWSLCLRRAGWPDDRPVWTGSCPCGPFSRAGLGKGFSDPRHLWPQWFRLIRERRPDVIFGEQSADANHWIDLVSSDLESVDYAIGSPDIPAAGFSTGAHKRNRFGFVADANNTEWWSDRAPWHDGDWPATGRIKSDGHLGDGLAAFSVGDAGRDGSPAFAGDDGQMRSLSEAQCQPEQRAALPGRSGSPIGVANPDSIGRKRCGSDVGANPQRSDGLSHIRAPGLLGGAGSDWILGRDGRWRPIESGLSPVVDAYPERLGLLRGYGDAIDVAAFTNLIGAYLDAAPSPWRQAA